MSTGIMIIGPSGGGKTTLGKALLGHKKDDRVFVQVKEKVGYYVKILEIMKSDDESEAINKF